MPPSFSTLQTFTHDGKTIAYHSLAAMETLRNKAHPAEATIN